MTSSPYSFEPPRVQQLLAELGRVAQQFKAWLDTEPQIDLMDQVSIDNHLAIFYICYGTWKAKYGTSWRDRPRGDSNPSSS